MSSFFAYLLNSTLVQSYLLPYGRFPRRKYGGMTAAQTLESRTYLSAVTLEPSFGDSGQTVTDFTATTGTDDEVTAVRSLPNGKTLVVGSTNPRTFSTTSLSRYNSDGTLDTTFGDDGRITTRLLASANDVQVLQNGSILLAGKSLYVDEYEREISVMAVLKLSSSGQVDESFGVRGLATTPASEALSLAVQPDGKILVAGTGFVVARFNANGSLDTTYATDGITVVDFHGSYSGYFGEAREIKIDAATGRAVVAGYAYDGTDRDFAIVRLTTEGQLDGTFGTDGRATTDFPGGRNDEAFSLVITANGIITAGGFTERTTGTSVLDRDFALVQYNSNGSLRSTFGTNGRVTTDFSRGGGSTDQIYEIKLDSSNRVVAVGGASEFDAFNPREDFAMARYSGSTGAIDSAIGTAGRIYLSFYASRGEQAKAIDIDSTGRWVVGGGTYINSQRFNDSDSVSYKTLSNFALARLSSANATLDTSFGNSGRVVTDFSATSGTDDQLTAIHSLPDGKTLAVGKNRGVGSDGYGATSLVSRYNSNGTLDTTFGDRGRVATSLLTNANDVYVMANGSILLGGQTFNPSTKESAGALLKLTSAGLIDETFGTRGLAVANFYEILCLTVQNDGKILIAGSNFAVSRLNANGSLDTTYATSGNATIDFLGNYDRAEARDIKIDPATGNAVLAGIAWIDYQNSDFAIVRLTPQGRLDATFHADGRVTTDLTENHHDQAFSLVINAASIITVGGFTERVDSDSVIDRDFALVQYSSNGSLRSSFGIDGRITTDFSRGGISTDQIYEIHLDSSNRIVAVGGVSEFDAYNPREDFAMARYDASTGAIDSALGAEGRIFSSFYASRGEQATAIDIDSSGRWVVGGFTYVDSEQILYDFGEISNMTVSNFALLRLNPADATLDPTFGNSGRVTTDFSANIGTDDELTAIRSLPDGKILAVGKVRDNSLSQNSVISLVSRYNSNGILDDTFGDGGRIAISVLSSANDVQVLANGSILLAGRAENSINGDTVMAVLKLTSSGLIDESFGNRGLAIANFYGDFAEAASLAVQLDGKVIVAGTTEQPYFFSETEYRGDFDFAIARFNANGSLDTTYATGGKIAINFENYYGTANDKARDIKIDPATGKAVVAGYATDENHYTWAMVRLTTQGRLDTTFGTDGRVAPPRRFDEAFSLVIGEGGIITAGGASDGNFLLVQFNSDGSLRTSFGNNGRVTTDFSRGKRSAVYEIKLDSANRIVAAGGSFDFDASNRRAEFALARYDGSTGEIDSGIGDQGRIYSSFYSSRGEQANAFDLDSTGSWIVGGSTCVHMEEVTSWYEPSRVLSYSRNFAIAKLVEEKPQGTAGNDSFVLKYSGASPKGKVTVVMSTNGGPSRTVGTYTMNTPLTVDGRGGTDTVRIEGTFSTDTLLVTSAGVTINGSSLLLSNVENRRLAGLGGSDNYRFDADGTLGLYSLDESVGGTDTIDFTPTTTIGVNLALNSAATQMVNSNLSLKLGSGLQFEKLIGSAKNDNLIGNSLANIIVGREGGDTLAGAQGDDSLIGGPGNDTYIFVPTSVAEADQVTENLNEGMDTLSFAYLATSVVVNLGSTSIQPVHANRTLKLNSSVVFENLIGGTGADTLFGSSLNNTLTGKAGDDKLLGGPGNDLLLGGANNDTYTFVATTVAEADQVTENLNDGIDTLNFAYLTTSVVLNLGSIAVQPVHLNRTLKLNSVSTFENAVGGTGNDTLLGNARANRLTGGNGNNILVGLEDRDILEAGSGRDILIGGLGLDVLNGGVSDDILIGGRTTSDTSLSNLNTLRAQWISANPYSVRIANLRAGVGRPIVSLKAKTNVLTDAGEDDVLVGRTGTDWYFRALDDVISGLVTGEMIDVL